MSDTKKQSLCCAPCWILLMGILLSGCSAKETAKERFALADVIPTGKTTVEILQLGFSERVEYLSKRMISAVATNQDWWIDYVKKHAARHVRRLSDAYVVFKRKGDLLSIDIGDPSSPVEKWFLNVSTGELLTHIGNIGKPEWTSSDDKVLASGGHEGYDWQLEVLDDTKSNIKVVGLSVYRLKPSSMIFWRLKDGETQNNRTIRSLDLCSDTIRSK